MRPTLTAGFVLAAIGLAWFTQVDANGSYVSDVLFPSIIVAMGIGLFFVSGTLAATAGVKPTESGLASGLLNTSQQVGGALGLAILSTLAANRTADRLADGSSQAVAAVDGFQLGVPDRRDLRRHRRHRRLRVRAALRRRRPAGRGRGGAGGRLSVVA